MPKIPFAHDLPEPLRKIGRLLAGPALRQRLAADIQHLAHLQARNHPLFQRSRHQLADLAGRHAGAACVIIGNGPSIAGQDLSALSGITTFALNRGYLLWNEQRLAPSYLLAVNDLVIRQFSEEIAAVACPVFVPWQHRTLFDGKDHVVFIEPRWHRRFFRDVTQGLWAGATVTFAAMQLAYHMGFRTVILIGVDHRFAEPGPPHAEVLQSGSDMNHFRPDYFGKGVRWNLPDLVQSEENYRLARSVFEADGRRIINATDGGALDIFERMTLADALRDTP